MLGNYNRAAESLHAMVHIAKGPRRWLLLGVVILIYCIPARSQQAAGDLSAESFLALRDKREELTKQIDEIEKLLKDLQNAEYWLDQEADARKTLDRKEKSHRLTQAERNALDKKIEDARAAAATESDLDQLRLRLKEKQGELVDKRKQKDGIDAEMSRRIDLETPKQKFKTNMSLVFAVLVGLVILGFFVIAWKDDTVRREIFSGTSGIQFVTLFSLVIAIILFGITGILEGKELAALLGGLSGYILGRGAAGTHSSSGQPPPAAPTPAEPHAI